MHHVLRATPLLVALALLPGSATAQAARATFIDWGNVTASVYADPNLGVQVWVGTSYRAMNERSRSVTLGFHPDSVYPWADGAALVIAPARAPRDSGAIIATPSLRAIDGTRVRLLRRAAGAVWEDRVVLSFEAPDTAVPPLNIATRPAEARSFVDALFQKAGTSALTPDWAERLASRGRIQCADQSQLVAASVASGAVPEYPITALGSGRVLLEFVIGADGWVDRQTVVPIAATDPVFIRPSVDALVGSRFTPATCRGTRIATVARQSINFVR
jgi:hypothetical protein